MKFCDIHMRDPFILAEEGVYYLYGTRGPETWVPGTGIDVYTSTDLENWEKHPDCYRCSAALDGRVQFWAPEVYHLADGWYMFLTLNCNPDKTRGTHCFKADSPLGPFLPHSVGSLTPPDVICLDGTLWFEDGVPYMIYCENWSQFENKAGKMSLIRLKADLTASDGEAVVLFDALAPDWAPKVGSMFVTDGPFLFHDADGRLGMIWSSFVGGQYVEGVAYSESGSVTGPWVQCDRLVFEKDGGHGMFFKTFGGAWKFTYHSPNKAPDERPALMDAPAWLKLK